MQEPPTPPPKSQVTEPLARVTAMGEDNPKAKGNPTEKLLVRNPTDTPSETARMGASTTPKEVHSPLPAAVTSREATIAQLMMPNDRYENSSWKESLTLPQHTGTNTGELTS